MRNATTYSHLCMLNLSQFYITFTLFTWVPLKLLFFLLISLKLYHENDVVAVYVVSLLNKTQNSELNQSYLCGKPVP